MRQALALGVALVLTLTASCSSLEPKQPDPGQGYVLQTTGAAVGRDDPHGTQREPTIGEVATRMAGQICEREARCHAATAPPAECMQAYSTVATLVIASWSCSPAATRARAKECVASLNAEPCELDLATKPLLCGPSAACPDENAMLESPGAEVAKSRERSPYPAFDVAAARAAMKDVDLTPCREKQGPENGAPKGAGHIVVTFAPDGAVLDSSLDPGVDGTAVSLDGTPRGQCVVEAYRKIRVPLFEGPPQKIGASIPLE